MIEYKREMKKTVLAFCALAAFAGKGSAGYIDVVYPPEGVSIPYASGTFIFGNVFPSTAALSINASEVKVHKNGAFLAYLPVSGGIFSFNCRLEDGAGTAYSVRRIKVGEPAATAASSGACIDPASVSPSAPVELRAGDWLQVSARGTPGLNAEFSVPGLKKGLPMPENPPGSGLYSGALQVREEDETENAPVRITLKGKGWSTAKAEAPGTVTVSKSQFKIIETSAEDTALRTGPGTGYMMFLPLGIRMLSNGQSGKRMRVWLSETESGWVDSSQVKVLPQGTPPPQAVMSTVKTLGGAGSATVAVSISQRVPFYVETYEDSLVLTLYHTRNHTNWIIYDSSDTFIDEIRWKQSASQTCRVTVSLSKGQRLWGYDVRYSGGWLNLELRKPPRFSGKSPEPLKGLAVILDPGHSLKKAPPYDGAIGPMRTLEPEANLAIAREIEAGLLKLGASVTLTRQGEEEVTLQDRPRLAWEAGGDIFISVHNNALPDGENPFAVPRGFSVYYYHPHSGKLAEALHRSYQKNIPLPDEGLRYGDYLVARITQMPSVLIESAYLMFPEQEELLNSPSFRKKLSSAVTEGIYDFLGIPRKTAAPPAVREKTQVNVQSDKTGKKQNDKRQPPKKTLRSNKRHTK